jgi:hypothetical protein
MSCARFRSYSQQSPQISARRIIARRHSSAGLTQQTSSPQSKEIDMRKILLSALAATTLLSAGMLASRAAATTSSEAATAAASQAPVREASIVCGGVGCNVVQTKGVKHRKLQWLGHG